MHYVLLKLQETLSPQLIGETSTAVISILSFKEKGAMKKWSFETKLFGSHTRGIENDSILSESVLAFS